MTIKQSFIRLCCFFTLLSPLICAAQSSATINIPKTEAEIVLDGELNEEFWQNATQVELDYETRPAENGKPPVKTTAYIIENGNSLLVAFKADDPEVNKIQASLKDRDTVWADDMVGFKVDTFNDGRKAYNFFANPFGIQMDSIEDDVTGNEDSSWNAIWYSQGKLTEQGYQVEMRIPFKVLRFIELKGEKTWGIDFMRMYPRQHHHRFAYNKVERNINCAVCQIGKATGFENIESGNNFEVTPYLSAQRIDNRNPPEQRLWQQGDTDFDGGVDIRWGVTDNSVLNATINPDFSQVESDALQLDVNTNFALFFQEKRSFFLEGADYFQTPFNLLHTRNIADPDYGIKYTGKTGQHSYGALVARDNSTSYLLPASQSSDLNVLEGQESDAAAFRYSYDVGEKSQLGAMITHRSGDNYQNSVASFDGKYQINDEDYIRYQVAYSLSEDPVELVNQDGSVTSIASDEKSGLGYLVSYRHDGRNWSWRAQRTEIDDDFRADLGFINQVGYRKDVIGLNHTWHGEKDDSYTRISLGGDIDQTVTDAGQKLEEEAEINFNFNGAYQSFIGFGGGIRDAWYANDDSLNECYSGCWFEQSFYWLSANFRPINNLQIGMNYNGGDTIDFSVTRAAKRKRLSLWFNWQVTRHWYLSSNLSNSTLDISEGNLFDADSMDVRSTYQFNKENYIRLTLRYQKVDFNQTLFDSDTSLRTTIGRQLLYAYKLNPRTVFFFGYSDGGFENDTVEQFERSGRSIFSKFSYALQI